MNALYGNIGRKIKTLAFVWAIIQAVGAFIAGIVLMADDEDLIPVGLLIALLGPVVAWIMTWLLYGFGDLIEKTGEIARNTRGGMVKSEAQAKIDQERINKFEVLRAQGLISEEEYRQAMSRMQ